MFHHEGPVLETHLFLGQNVKGQGHKAQKRVFLHSSFFWFTRAMGLQHEWSTCLKPTHTFIFTVLVY